MFFVPLKRCYLLIFQLDQLTFCIHAFVLKFNRIQLNRLDLQSSFKGGDLIDLYSKDSELVFKLIYFEQFLSHFLSMFVHVKSGQIIGNIIVHVLQLCIFSPLFSKNLLLQKQLIFYLSFSGEKLLIFIINFSNMFREKIRLLFLCLQFAIFLDQ